MKPKNATINAEDIDAILPQTQCRLCNYAGCMPYAEAIINDGERIDQCLPGGIETLGKIAKLLQRDPSPYLEEMKAKAKPALTAVIQEDQCIGCTKCIQACPVDAIIGASKQMHTILSDACTGCELCVPPCPVDCIDILPIPKRNESEQLKMAKQSRQRYQQRQQRLQRDLQERRQKHQAAKLAHSNQSTIAARQAAIAAAVERVRNKKESQQHEQTKTD